MTIITLEVDKLLLGPGVYSFLLHSVTDYTCSGFVFILDKREQPLTQ